MVLVLGKKVYIATEHFLNSRYDENINKCKYDIKYNLKFQTSQYLNKYIIKEKLRGVFIFWITLCIGVCTINELGHMCFLAFISVHLH